MLDKATLNTSILSLLTDMEKRTENSKNEFARRLSDAIEIFVKSGTVTVDSGIAVSTAGTATAQTGATTATGTGTIS